MAIAKMSKINIVASLDEKEGIMEAVQDVGLLQVEETPGDETLERLDIEEKLNDVEYKLAGIRFCLNFLADYDTKKKSLAERFNLKKIELTEQEMEEKVKNFNFKFFKEVQEVQRKINQAHNIIERTKEEIKVLTPWKDLNFIPSSYNLPDKLDFKLLSLPHSVLEDLKLRLKENTSLFELKVVQEGKKELKVSLVYHVDSRSMIAEVLDDLNIKTEEVPEIYSSVPKYINSLKKKIQEQEKVLEDQKKRAEELCSGIKDLKIIFDYLSWQRDRLSALQKTVRGWKFFSLLAWIEEDKVEELEKKLSRTTKKFFIEKVEAEEGEKPPVVFKNSWLSRPFEFITGIYGSPKDGSPDPTPFLAPFFIVFFGLCLTDAGYGIILALLAFLGIKVIKPEREAKKMFLVLLYGGLATFFAGALVGGWFGIAINDLSDGWLKSFLLGLKLIDPVENPISMLLFSLALGVVQIFTGIMISMWWKLKHHDTRSALLDDAMWLYFLTAILVWGAHSFGMIDLALSKYLVWIGIAGIIVTQGRKADNPALKLVTGVLGLYGVVGYLSDVLSYSRLLALGLATSIIAMVVNLIASLTVDMIPYLGYVIALFILIGGHVFNIAINALGSFIHSSRLQFVEFFPKFMESGGVSLSPVKRENKYTKII